ncbi:hypothetical protein GIB67_019627 [Kingdonia uniflora]|uniref:GPI ethanolamine phosphate transferase 2 C-terminal domain-containing protein n=1 Tax=Kingdonia uniflora TaxID=39325 RepID=A0A7J7N0Q4_9MAGN|nr:hypothetical protein GIB67_019627 [Kingdonia uniflora]
MTQKMKDEAGKFICSFIYKEGNKAAHHIAAEMDILSDQLAFPQDFSYTLKKICIADVQLPNLSFLSRMTPKQKVLEKIRPTTLHRKRLIEEREDSSHSNFNQPPHVSAKKSKTDSSRAEESGSVPQVAVTLEEVQDVKSPSTSGGDSKTTIYSTDFVYLNTPVSANDTPQYEPLINPAVEEQEQGPRLSTSVSPQSYLGYWQGGGEDPEFGSFLFTTKKGTDVSPKYLNFFESKNSEITWSWRAATLVHLYYSLGASSRVNAKALVCCTTLLEIFEYFPKLPGIPKSNDSRAPEYCTRCSWSRTTSDRSGEKALKIFREALDNYKLEDAFLTKSLIHEVASSVTMSSSLTCAKLASCTMLAVVLQMIGIALFVLGFFPVKPALPGISGLESYRAPTCNEDLDANATTKIAPDELKNLYKEMSELPPSYDRLILMVVDGLPAEFILGKGDQPPTKAVMEAMPYTQSLLSNGTSIGYHAKAAPPTVTMPRLKAMVSGAIGGFLDVALNFNTQAFLDDNLLGQFHRIGWKMVMHGDETWIKLFPGVFARHDGVTSFFVKDTTEVDYNVSRHLKAELVAEDWNILILHYLGLDHVGHIGGRNSILMTPKLKEMDEVIKLIHTSMVQRPEHCQEQTLLMVVSDHGMTYNGNHGGSSYEETDSLALFIGMESKLPQDVSATYNVASQVDIAPTVALHFGVPIPRNSIGVLIPETSYFLTDGQSLRALELNSWQLLRLLEAQLPGLLCGNTHVNDINRVQTLGFCEQEDSVEQEFFRLYLEAVGMHSSWRSQEGQDFRSNSSGDYRDTVTAYYEFLNTASEWLSRRATDKSSDLLVFGIAAMLVSCVIFLSILFWLCQEERLRQGQSLHELDDFSNKWHLDEIYIFVIILVLVLSLGSSSMVEEEQYIWNFTTSTLYLIFLRRSIQGDNYKKKNLTFSIIVVLICGRILRGWHQGGVNWVHLPDISKWLEKANPHIISSIQIFSGIFIIILGSFVLYVIQSKRVLVLGVHAAFSVSGFLVLLSMMEPNYMSTLMPRIIYVILIMTVTIAALVSPWASPNSSEKPLSVKPNSATSHSVNVVLKSPIFGLRETLYLIGWAYTVCWCVLQLLLHQPINAMPIVLILLQIWASIYYFSASELHHKQWVEVAALYFLGMTGHFGLGNSNTLATIDVAGAFMGLSSHSALLSGILMFSITYTSPLLCLLSMTTYISLKNMSHLVSQNMSLGHHIQLTLGFPCLVPLTLNSIASTAFTIILLLMRNHLFVWSVFSPKYLYVCAMTVCVYIGVLVVFVTKLYTSSVFLHREKMQSSTRIKHANLKQPYLQ